MYNEGAITFSEGWTFRREGETAERSVRVPHDWGIESGFLKAGACPAQGDLPFVGKGFYRRAFDGFTPPPDEGYLPALIPNALLTAVCSVDCDTPLNSQSLV